MLVSVVSQFRYDPRRQQLEPELSRLQPRRALNLPRYQALSRKPKAPSEGPVISVILRGTGYITLDLEKQKLLFFLDDAKFLVSISDLALAAGSNHLSGEPDSRSRFRYRHHYDGRFNWKDCQPAPSQPPPSTIPNVYGPATHNPNNTFPISSKTNFAGN